MGLDIHIVYTGGFHIMYFDANLMEVYALLNWKIQRMPIGSPGLRTPLLPVLCMPTFLLGNIFYLRTKTQCVYNVTKIS